MSIGLIFWIIMILWLIFALAWNFNWAPAAVAHGPEPAEDGLERAGPVLLGGQQEADQMARRHGSARSLG